jgi:hypothetical protein
MRLWRWQALLYVSLGLVAMLRGHAMPPDAHRWLSLTLVHVSGMCYISYNISALCPYRQGQKAWLLHNM